MIIPDLVASFTALTAADLASCDRRALADLVSTSQRVRSWLDAFDGAIAVHAERLAERGACESGPSLLAGGGRRSSRDAEAAARRGAIGELLPSMRGALAAGEVSAGHADAVAKVAAQLDDTGRAELQALEPTLVASAVASSVEAFEREVRDLGRVLSRDDGVGQHERLRNQRSVKRWQDRQTGMCHTHLSLDPEADARVGAAFDAAVAAERARPDVDDRTLDQLRADVLVDLIAGARSTDRRVPEMSVLVDLDTLRRGLHDHSVCETSDGVPVPPATVRRLACEATIVPIVLNSAGVALDVGRQVRVANREQRRALRAMHRTCAHPGCHVRFADCEVHHVVEWTRHGSTDLHNLVPLCSRHHHLVHEGHWRSPCTPIAPRRGAAPTAVCTPGAPPSTSPPRAWRPQRTTPAIGRGPARPRSPSTSVAPPVHPPTPPTRLSSTSPEPGPGPSARPAEPPPHDPRPRPRPRPSTHEGRRAALGLP